MTEIIHLDKTNHDTIKKQVVYAIKQGNVIIYPTDTVYGIGGAATSESVVARIYELKRRSQSKALSVAFSDFYMLSKYCALDASQEAVIKKYLPGPYTFIVKSSKRLPVSSSEILGIRIPNDDLIRDIIQTAALPLITTSANLSGGPDVFDFSKLHPDVLAGVDVALDCGETKYKQSSTVVDLIHHRLLREGAGKWG